MSRSDDASLPVGPDRDHPYPTREERLRTGLARYQELVPDWEAFLEVCGRPLPTCGWINPGRATDTQLLAADGFRLEPLPWRPGGFRLLDGPSMADSLAYRAGLFHVQEEASMIPARLLRPQPGDRVLDLCAAPGNKTAELSSLVGPTGAVIANDRAGARLNTLRTTLDRLGLTNVGVTNRDGRSQDWIGQGFDAVLVDVPCSCDGTVRKHASAAWKTSEIRRAQLSDLQTELLLSAIGAVRPGGRVAYSTCAFAPEENELVVQRVLESIPGLRIVPPGPLLDGLAWDPGLVQWRDRSLHPDMAHTVRLWPHRADAGGFFAALLEVPEGPDELTSTLVPARDSTPRPTADRGLRSAPDSVPAELLDWITVEYGLKESWKQEFGFQLTGKSLDVHAARASLTIPGISSQSGLTIFRMHGRTPKLTTAGAQLLGNRISSQWVDIGRGQASVFFRREVTRPVESNLSAYGYVQVRADGLAVGVGLYRPDEGILESLYPKTWGGLGPPTESQPTATGSGT